MPTSSRQTVRILTHRAASGLFRADNGEYVADIKPDDGARVRRNFGKDKERAFVLFDALLDELANQRVERAKPKVVDFLTGTFLDAQRHLKVFDFAEWRVRAIVKFFEARYQNLRLADVCRVHADALNDYYADRSPRTRNGNVQKFKQAMNVAVDLELLDANPLARYKGLRFDNRRILVCDMDEFIAVINAARGDVKDIALGLAGLRPSNVFCAGRDKARACKRLAQFADQPSP